MASLYWRAQGNLANAIECLRSALHAVPAPLSDVPLTNLAAVLYRLDDVDGALKLARQAHNVDSLEVSGLVVVGSGGSGGEEDGYRGVTLGRVDCCGWRRTYSACDEFVL